MDISSAVGLNPIQRAVFANSETSVQDGAKQTQSPEAGTVNEGVSRESETSSIPAVQGASNVSEEGTTTHTGTSSENQVSITI